jgi:hypothetical protein
MKAFIQIHLTIFAVIYLFGIIITAEYDILSWNEEARLGYVVFSEFFSLICGFVYFIIKEI